MEAKNVNVNYTGLCRNMMKKGQIDVFYQSFSQLPNVGVAIFHLETRDKVNSIVAKFKIKNRHNDPAGNN